MENDTKSTRQRSPNYPAYPLQAAIEFVRRVYATEKRSAVPLVIVGRALSDDDMSSGLSGPARSKIASMRQYSLLEDTGNGKLRVSDRALAILQKPSPTQYALAVCEASLAPALFTEIREQHADASDSALRYYLMTEKQFTEDGANRALRSYRETMEFANLQTESYTAEGGPVTLGEQLDESSRKFKVSQASASVQGPASLENLSRGVNSMAYTWPLPDDVVAQVALLGSKPTVRAINRLITFLEFMRDDLNEGAFAKGPQDAPAADA